MKVHSERLDGRILIYALPDQDDLTYTASRKAKLGRGGMFSVCAHHHPDLYGLAVLLAVGPFTAKGIELDLAVSEQFAEAVQTHLKRAIGPVDKKLQPRPLGSRDALAFSGGVDSVAALALLGKETIPIFLDRVSPGHLRPGLYNSAAAHRSIGLVRQAGFGVVVAPTSMEFIREPRGFPVDWSNAMPAVLLADELDLRSISFGMIAESAFMLGHKAYSDLASRAVYSSWAPLFEAAGIPISLPTAGLSEVVTSRIARDFAHWGPQSCVRGQAEQPCGKCFKCFRKAILDASLGGSIEAPHFNGLSPEVGRRLTEMPVHHESVLAYSIHRMPEVDHQLYRDLRDLTTPFVEHYGLDLLTKLYPRGLDYVPEFMRERVRASILAYADEMTPEEVAAVESWDLMPLVAKAEYQAAHARVAGTT
jgi:hypothetical protein